MAVDAATNTPGYNHRLDIWFATTRKGTKRAYYWSYAAFRAMPMALATAELLIAQGQADHVASNPWKVAV